MVRRIYVEKKPGLRQEAREKQKRRFSKGGMFFREAD